MASNKFIIFVVLNSLVFNHSNAASATVQSVCKRSTDYGFCISTFASDPRSDTLDLRGLGLLSIQITVRQLQETLDKFPRLLRRITDPVGRRRLNVCLTDYKTAVTKFNGAFGSSDKKAYQNVINWVRDGTNAVIHCQNIYRSPPISESPISAEIHKLLNLAGVILTVNDMLIGV